MTGGVVPLRRKTRSLGGGESKEDDEVQPGGGGFLRGVKNPRVIGIRIAGKRLEENPPRNDLALLVAGAPQTNIQRNADSACDGGQQNGLRGSALRGKKASRPPTIRKRKF